MSKHYRDRFEMGIERMIDKREKMSQEYVGSLGGGSTGDVSFGLGDPQAPYEYGKPF
jgi:hypothetical protein